MRRLKTKRVLWTIAIFVALSLIAVLLLHRPEQPKIIGKLSPGDVSDITESFRSGIHRTVKALLINDLKSFSLLSLKRHYLYFGRLKVTSIEVVQSDIVLVSVGTGTNGSLSALAHRTKSGAWSFTKFDAIAPPRPSNQATNTAPVSQHGVVPVQTAEKSK